MILRRRRRDLAAIHAELKSRDADIVKLATMANNPHDNLRMLTLMAETDFPTVGLCMGEMGMPSRILAGKYGAPFTYATFTQERTLGSRSNQLSQDAGCL